ncbi:MAG: ribonucleotide reductase N-terminal alpha domain-containing protein [Candidatus Velthaea sp.]
MFDNCRANHYLDAPPAEARVSYLEVPMSTELPRGLSEPSFDPNAMRVLNERYFARKPDGSVETPKEFLWRVASAIAVSERPYAEKAGRNADAVVDGVAHAFYDMLARRDFMPNTPCLVNAGRPLSMLSACFVLPVPDSIDGIFYNLKAMALIQKSGGGTGYAFSELRGNGAMVQSTGKDASGPVSFMKVFNAATDSIKQGGVRRGANMGVLRVDHPDVFHFMQCKKELDSENRALYNRMSDTGRYTEAQLSHIKQELLQTQMNNFNISIGVTDAFMDAVEKDADFDLVDPRSKEIVRTVKATDIWNGIIEGAWQNGEPGVLFLDHPEWNPLPGLGPIQATNPCVTADTWVTTADGAVQVKDLVGVPFTAVVDGQPHRSTGDGFFFKGIKPVHELKTRDGYSVKATADHKIMTLDDSNARVWKPLGELAAGDRIVLHEHVASAWEARGTFDEGALLGSLVGDGHFHRRAGKSDSAVLDYWGPHAEHLSEIARDRIRQRLRVRADFRGIAVAERSEIRLECRALADLAKSFGITPERKGVSNEVERASFDFYRGFLRGWFDADGTVGGTLESGYTIRLTSIHEDDLRSAQRMLGRLGIRARIFRNRRPASVRSLPDGKGGMKHYDCQAYHELSISRVDFPEFARLIGFDDPDKALRLETFAHTENRAKNQRRYAEVATIEPKGLAPVFDCTIPGPHAFDANGIYVSNCGEQALHGYDSCNLGSINVGHFYDSSKRDVDWDRLAQATGLAIRFLDNVIDANLYPLDEIREMVTNNRRVGLGIMGFADLLVQMQVAYGSSESIDFAAKLMKFMQTKAEDTSEILARERGEFPNKHLSKWKDDPRPRRNAALLSIAPTGTISMIAGCSFGCEPYFGIAYTKHVMKDSEGRPQHLYYVLPLFEEIATDEGFFSDALLGKVELNRGSVKGIAEVPAKWQEIFTVAADVTVDQHIDILAAFQKYTCNAVSKTINAPNDDTRENVARSIFRAYKSGCKGFTYYRDGSRTEQVVTFSKDADISGANRDADAGKPTAAIDAAAAVVRDANAPVSDPLEALLARANALLK